MTSSGRRSSKSTEGQTTAAGTGRRPAALEGGGDFPLSEHLGLIPSAAGNRQLARVLSERNTATRAGLAPQVAGCNRLLARAVRERGPSRGEHATPASDSDAIHPDAMRFLEGKLRELYEALPVKERTNLYYNGTVAIGMVDIMGEPHLVYTTNHNRASRRFQAAAKQLGLVRWRYDSGVKGRGAIGAPNDAEQLLVECSIDAHVTLWGMATSRSVCADCETAVITENGRRVPVSHVPDPVKLESPYKKGNGNRAGGAKPRGPRGGTKTTKADQSASSAEPDAAAHASERETRDANTELLPESPPLERVGESGYRAELRTPDMRPVEELRPSQGATSAADLGVVGLQGLNFVIGWANAGTQLGRIQKALEAAEPEIARVQSERPADGALVTIVLKQQDVSPDSPLQPGPVFAWLDIGYGPDERAAMKDLQTQPWLLPGLEAGQHRMVGARLWVAPLIPQPSRPPRPPLPVFALATFAAARPVLQNVKWQNLDGFDDEDQTALVVPDGMDPRFYVLQIPKELASVIPRERNPEIERHAIPLAMRGGVPVVLLDPLLPFTDVVAAAIFPADAATAKLFERAPVTAQSGEVLIDDFDLVRWARPEQIRIIGR